jgi:glyoxylase-like metal-dependent hydrolase (beta-lactamase superfamily II)
VRVIVVAEVRAVEARVERVWTPRVEEGSTGAAAAGPDEARPDQARPDLARSDQDGQQAADLEAEGLEGGGHAVDELNAWLVGDDEEVIVIDPGEDPATVLEQVGEREVLAVICTHGHASHVAAAVEVAERDEAPVALHRADRVLWRMSHDGEDPEIEMAAGGKFEVSDVTLEVIHTPGHTPGSVSLFCEELGVVFTGDALSARGPVPHGGVFGDFPGQLTAIGERLLDLPMSTRVLAGHGEETTIGDAAKRFDGWVTAGPAGEFA